MTNFPTSLDSFTNPTSGQNLNSPSHSTQHTNINDAVAALEAKLGINGSAVTTSHSYKLGGVTGTDKAASLTGAEVLTNKTLSAPVLNLGSDATGDIYYRNSGGVLTRLAIGSAAQILQVSVGGLPAWVANPAASNGSTTVAGVFQKATTAEITAGTGTGTTGALLVIGADAVGVGNSKLVQFTAGGLYPAADGSLITNIPGSKLSVSSSTVDVNTTLTETALLSFSVPAGTLGTNNAIEGTLFLSAFNLNVNSATGAVIRLKYGSTTIATLNVNDAGSSIVGSGFITFNLIAAGSASSQVGNIAISAGNDSITAPSSAVGSATGTAAEASAGALTLTVTIQFANNAAGNRATMNGYVVRKVS